MQKLTSPNFNQRPAGIIIDTLVIHYTGMKSAEDALNRLCDPKCEVSSHYVIDEDGIVYNLVREQDRAWHAGKSFWRGRENVNDFSIGIELVNPGHEFGYRPFPKTQMDSLISLCRDVLKRNTAITSKNIVGHSDIAPQRKEDPGELFNWKLLAENGIGIWHYILEDKIKYANKDNMINDISKVQHQLANYGYQIEFTGTNDEQTKKVITAFQRHFIQHKLDGVWGVEEEAALQILFG